MCWSITQPPACFGDCSNSEPEARCNECKWVSKCSDPEETKRTNNYFYGKKED